MVGYYLWSSMKRFTCAAFIVLAIVMAAPVCAEENFDLGDLVEIVSLMPVIIDGIVGFVAICRQEGLVVGLVLVMIYTTVSIVVVLLANLLFGPCIKEISKKKYQPVRIAANVWVAGRR